MTCPHERNLDACVDCGFGGVARGRAGRDLLLSRIEWLEEQLNARDAELRAVYANLTATQQRCTELLDEVRSLRACLRSPSWGHLDTGVVCDVAVERYRADVKHGSVDWYVATPDGSGGADAAAFVVLAKDACERAWREGKGTWRHILEEETAEAFAEVDPVKLRAELIQVACVAMKWVEAIDKRGGVEGLKQISFRDPVSGFELESAK